MARTWQLITAGEFTEGLKVNEIAWVGIGVDKSINNIEYISGSTYSEIWIFVKYTNTVAPSLNGYFYVGEPYKEIDRDFTAFTKIASPTIVHYTNQVPPQFYFYVKNASTSPMVSGETIGTGDGTTTTFSKTLAYPKVAAGSLSITYTIGGNAYTATDDGNGNISGTDCSGTINYDTGEVNLTFTTAPDNGTSIKGSYDQLVTFEYVVYGR